jgi:carbon monoxide dehydrogenase subunit G
MDLTGEYRIPAPREAVWKALNDPEILKQSIPGCETIDKVSDTEMTAKVTAKVGPVKASFSGKVTLSDLDPPNGYKISGEGQGGVAGFAKGGADVRLKPDESGAGTILTYTATASVGGKLAQIGSRLIEGTSKQMADQFFGKFAEIVGSAAAPAEVAAAPVGAPPPPAPAQAPAPAPAQRGLPPLVWVGGLIAIVVILLLIFGVDW